MKNSVLKGLLSYLLGVVGPLIVIFAFSDNTRNDLFHAYQSLTISIISVVVSIAVAIMGMIPYIGFLFGIVSFGVSIFLFVLVILGVIKACKDEADPKLVLVGDITEKIFGKQINAVPANAPATPAAKFDPNTGQPINSQPEAKFDPNTGQPINQPAPEKPAEPVNTEAPADQPSSENTDQNN